MKFLKLTVVVLRRGGSHRETSEIGFFRHLVSVVEHRIVERQILYSFLLCETLVVTRVAFVGGQNVLLTATPVGR